MPPILISILLGVVLTQAYPQQQQPGLASRYPHDLGIEKDPQVLFAEDFEQDNFYSRYTDILNQTGMSADKDMPAGSRGKYSLKITNTGGQNTGGHLYRSFKPGFDSVVFVRYYVKYPKSDSGFIHHEGIWIGGYDPVLDYPSPKAGSCNVEGRISVSYEPGEAGKQMDNYIYWPLMNSGNGFRCFGNVLYDPALRHRVEWDEWMCIEVMIRLNNPVSASNGELAIWKNGVLVSHWKPGSPNGHWQRDHWIANDHDPGFEGFRWRTKPSLNINYLWIEYFDDKSPAGVTNHIKYDHIVMATRYIGPIAH